MSLKKLLETIKSSLSVLHTFVQINTPPFSTKISPKQSRIFFLRQNTKRMLLFQFTPITTQQDFDTIYQTTVFFVETGLNAATPHVAFGAVISSGKSAEYTGTIVFNRVLTNIGGAYSRYSGKFTAPTRGTYLFNWAVRSGYKSSVKTKLMVNGY